LQKYSVPSIRAIILPFVMSINDDYKHARIQKFLAFPFE